MQNSESESTRQPSEQTDESSASAKLSDLWGSIVSSKPRRLTLAALIVAAATGAAMTVDCRLAIWCTGANCSDHLKRVFSSAEPFGHGMGVILVAVSVFLLDPRRRCAIPRLLLMSAGAGLTANVLKLLVSRTRPIYCSFEGGIADTFGGWLPFCDGGSSQQSFPSAHTATAVGLAVALGWLYPRGRWLFGLMALLVAFQRVESGCHYLSDTVCGAAVGLFVAFGCLNDRRLSAWFGRLESFLRARQLRDSITDPAAGESQPPPA